MKRILVDMSATIIHHGHIRLLSLAKEHGYVIVALTTDDEIISKKGYTPELAYTHREEILRSIKYVDDVIPSPWLITDEFLTIHHIDFLVHGSDNSNLVDKSKLLIFPRTPGISSTIMRSNVLNTVQSLLLSN